MEYSDLRKRMVSEQLIGRGIQEGRILEAFSSVERHLFVPENLRDAAYSDYPLPIGQGQTISQPYIVALMTESLYLTGEEKVLEIGTGSGYQTAILAKLVKQVYTVERLPELAKKAGEIFKHMGYGNIFQKTADGTLGWPEEAPFDRIIVTAAAGQIPPPLIEQLKDKGKLILPLDQGLGQELTLIEKINGNLKKTRIAGCVFVPLMGKYA